MIFCIIRFIINWCTLKLCTQRLGIPPEIKEFRDLGGHMNVFIKEYR